MGIPDRPSLRPNDSNSQIPYFSLQFEKCSTFVHLSEHPPGQPEQSQVCFIPISFKINQFRNCPLDGTSPGALGAQKSLVNNCGILIFLLIENHEVIFLLLLLKIMKIDTNIVQNASTIVHLSEHPPGHLERSGLWLIIVDCQFSKLLLKIIKYIVRNDSVWKFSLFSELPPGHQELLGCGQKLRFVNYF